MGHLVAGTLTRKLHAEVSSRTGEVETTVMRSTTIPRARNRARRASDSPTAHALARAGLTARGIIYILIGWVAVLVALGRGAHEADQQSALQLLAGKPYGSVSLGLLCIGFAAYAPVGLSAAAYALAALAKPAGPPAKAPVPAAVPPGLA